MRKPYSNGGILHQGLAGADGTLSSALSRPQVLTRALCPKTGAPLRSGGKHVGLPVCAPGPRVPRAGPFTGREHMVPLPPGGSRGA